MDRNSSTGREAITDTEIGVNSKGKESSRVNINNENHKHQELNEIWSRYISIDDSIRAREATSFNRDTPNSTTVNVSIGDLQGGRKFGDGKNASALEKRTDTEKPKKKNHKKPPRPPKAPSSFDAAEAKFVREMSELAILKRARVERMKALKNMKKAKPPSFTNNMLALVITVIFCFIIFWQGFGSRSSSNLNFEGSPISPVGNGGGLISVQFYKNASTSSSSDPSLASPNNGAQVSGSYDRSDDPSAYAR